MRIVLAAAACLALAACSDEPTESEMRTMVEAGARRTLQARDQPFQPFDGFRKQGCKETKNRAGHYDCYYAATLPAQPGRPAITVNGKARFHRTDQGLAYEDLGAQPR